MLATDQTWVWKRPHWCGYRKIADGLFDGAPAFSPDGSRIVTGTRTQEVLIWDAVGYQPLLIMQLDDGITSLRSLLTAHAYWVWTYDVGDNHGPSAGSRGRPPRVPHPAVTFSPDCFMQ